MESTFTVIFFNKTSLYNQTQSQIANLKDWEDVHYIVNEEDGEIVCERN